MGTGGEGERMGLKNGVWRDMTGQGGKIKEWRAISQCILGETMAKIASEEESSPWSLR
jgi:hypothetical protein